MNILQIISSEGFFGAENVLTQLSVELMRKEVGNVFVGVFENFRSPHLEVRDRCRENGVETYTFPCRGRLDFSTIRQIRNYVKDRRIDVVHSHGYKANIYSILSTYGLPTSLVATCHNWVGQTLKMKSYAALDRFVLRRFDSVVAVSENVKDLAIRSVVPSAKIRVVRNGISLQRFERSDDVTETKMELGIPDDTKIIGTVGRLSEEKGYQWFLRLAEQVVQKFPKTTFLIVGGGPLSKILQAEFKKPFILFTGVRNDIPRLYHCMDIFVLPSLREGLPMAILEAMASKLPVVATCVGSIPSVVSDKESGFLVKPGDGEEMKNLLQHLLENSNAAKFMGEKGYQIVKERFSSSRMAEEYIDIYKDVLV